MKSILGKSLDFLSGSWSTSLEGSMEYYKDVPTQPEYLYILSKESLVEVDSVLLGDDVVLVDLGFAVFLNSTHR